MALLLFWSVFRYLIWLEVPSQCDGNNIFMYIIHKNNTNSFDYVCLIMVKSDENNPNPFLCTCMLKSSDAALLIIVHMFIVSGMEASGSLVRSWAKITFIVEFLFSPETWQKFRMTRRPYNYPAIIIILHV